MLKSLIKNQKIRIDAHQRGNGHIDDWDIPSTDIHIHKTTKANIEGNKVSVDIMIPINSDREPTFKIGKTESIIARRKLSREIREALSNQDERQGFIDSLIEVLENYPTVLSSRDRCLGAIRRLIRHFELETKVADDLVIYSGDRILSFTSIFQDESERSFSISLDEQNIEIGEIDGYSRKQVYMKRNLK